jgi:pSer/pThr/pTyr-binding forkhead associated (FHA) protein
MRVLSIWLEEDKEEKYRTTSAELKLITIGRSKKSTWVVEDELVSGHHARLRQDGRKVVLEDDGSSNGLHHKGKRADKVVLRPSTVVYLGKRTAIHCEAILEKAAEKVPYIEVLSGKMRGKTISLPEGRKKIGRVQKTADAQKADIALPDNRISIEHAELEQAEGKVFIIDLNSLNGTKVNNEPLDAFTKRLLRNRDEISIASTKLQYFDGSTPPPPPVMRIVFLVLLTVSLCFFAYQLYINSQQSAKKHLQKAEEYVRHAEFDLAEGALASAADAPDYSKFRSEIKEFRNDLANWRRTEKLARQCLTFLGNQDWESAMEKLPDTVGRPLRSWSWGGKESPQIQALLKSANDALQTLDKLEKAKEDTELKLDKLPDLLKEGEDALALLGQSTEESWIGALRKELDVASGILSYSIQTLEHGQEALTKLGEAPWPSNVRQLATVKESIAPAASDSRIFACVQGWAKDRVGVVDDLNRSYQELIEAIETVTENKKPKKQLSLPDELDCANAGLSQIHEDLTRSFKKIRSDFSSIQNYENRIIEDLKKIKQHLSKQDLLPDTVLSELLQVRCLDKPFSQMKRCTYHAYLDKEYFYKILKAPDDMAEYVNYANGVAWDYRKLIGDINKFKAFLQKGGSYLNKNELAGKLEEYINYLETRDLCLNKLNLVFNKQTNPMRTRLIAGGLIVLITPDHESPTINAELKSVFETFENEMTKYNNEFDTAPTVEAQNKVIEKVLQVGLPGNPFVEQMWLLRDDYNSL